MKLLKKKRLIYIVFISLIASFCDAYITCSEEIGELCKKKDVHNDEIPYSKVGEMTAPTPECMTVTLLDQNGSEHLTKITWMQKWNDLQYVDGYYMSILNSAFMDFTTAQYLFQINKTELEKYKDESGYVTFSFNDHKELSGKIAIIISSMPMYQTDDNDHFLKVNMDAIYSDPYITKTETICLNNQTDNEGSEYGSEMLGIDSQEYDIGSSENFPTDPDDVEVSRDSPLCDTTGMVPVSVTIIACVISALMTVFTIIAAIALYYVICRAIEKEHKRRKKEMSNRGRIKKQESKIKSKVMIIANMMDAEEQVKDEIYKKAALCLANILYESGEFEVGCNLWVMKDIAQMGIAMWTHNIITSQDKIVLVCNPHTVAALKKYCPNEGVSQNKSLVHNPNSSAQIIYRILMSTHTLEKKLVIVCLNDEEHDCLANLMLPTLNHCERYDLVHQFAGLIQALYKNPNDAKRMKAEIMATMQKSLSHIFLANKNQDEIDKKVGNDFDRLKSSIQEQMWLMNENKPAQKLPDKKFPHKNNNPAATTEKIIPDMQFDSMFSSRCNSHSTETISSCGDTGFQETNHMHYQSHYHPAGARPRTYSNKL
ncbi:uncharacterized protein LOC120344273 [Styela clava]